MNLVNSLKSLSSSETMHEFNAMQASNKVTIKVLFITDIILSYNWYLLNFWRNFKLCIKIQELVRMARKKNEKYIYIIKINKIKKSE